MVYKALIVDDEKLARNRLRRLLKNFSDRVEIVGEAASGKEALKKIEALSPDLVFLDIQMPGKNGFEVLRLLKNPPQIIFVTAFDEYALKAFDANAIDYLLKPVKKERLKQALDKLQKHDNQPGADSLKNLLEYIGNQPSYLQRLTIRKGDRVQFLDVEQTVYFKAADKYTFAMTERREVIVDYTLSELEHKLPPEQFVRIHRNCIINRVYLIELRRESHGHYYAVMRLPQRVELPVSRGYLPKILPK